MPSKFKSIIIPILILIVVVAVTVTIIQFISVGIDLIRDKLNLPIGNMPTNIQEASTPIQDVPPETLDTTSNIKDIKTRELIVKPYTPSQNVFADQETYNKESLRLMLNGEFDIAQLHIKGTVKESGDHFLILNYGVVSGILNATRLSPNSIDLDLTRSRGGIFTNSETIDVVVNLMGQTILAATRSGFLLKRQGTISVNLWDANLMPPTITRVLVAPFNEKGNFGDCATCYSRPWRRRVLVFRSISTQTIC